MQRLKHWIAGFWDRVCHAEKMHPGDLLLIMTALFFIVWFIAAAIPTD